MPDVHNCENYMCECWANRWYMEIPLSAHLFCTFKIVLKNSLLTTKTTTKQDQHMMSMEKTFREPLRIQARKDSPGPGVNTLCFQCIEHGYDPQSANYPTSHMLCGMAKTMTTTTTKRTKARLLKSY